MASGTDTQTDRQTHTRILTRGPKQFQETRRVRPKATRAWFKNGGIAKGMPGSVQALPNTCCALLPSLLKIQIL